MNTCRCFVCRIQRQTSFHHGAGEHVHKCLARYPVNSVCSASAVQGNCSDPDAAAALELPRPGPRDAPLLPLKPFQCMLLLPDTFLAVEKGRVWVDNLYLKLMPKPQQVLRHLKRTPSFITAGRRLENSVSDDYNPGSRLENPAKTNLHLTDITFQGDDTQGARGVYLSGFAAETTVYVSGECPASGVLNYLAVLCVSTRVSHLTGMCCVLVSLTSELRFNTLLRPPPPPLRRNMDTTKALSLCTCLCSNS